VSLLRAGNDVLDLVPSARLGFDERYRDEATLKSVKYYFKVPIKLD
jgi:uracil phosphoribosyltransferase